MSGLFRWFSVGVALSALVGAGPAVAEDLYHGNGSLALTTSSALLSTLTVNAGSSPFPPRLDYVTLINVGATDAAFCPNVGTAGATCTCPANGVAATNGITLASGKGGYKFALGGGVASSAPTIVACSGTPTVQVQW